MHINLSEPIHTDEVIEMIAALKHFLGQYTFLFVGLFLLRHVGAESYDL